MEELINQASQIIQQSSNLLSHPVIGTAVTGLTSWIGGILGKPSAKEKIKQIEENNFTEETVAGLEANLEYILEDNKSLQNELAKKLKEFEELMTKEGVTMPTKTNTMNVTGNDNISFQDVASKGNINITK